MKKQCTSRSAFFISHHLISFALCSVGLLLPLLGWSQSVTGASATKAPAQTLGTWIPTGSFATARSSHTATLLPNGQLLVAGGYHFGPVPAGAVLYHPATRLRATT